MQEIQVTEEVKNKWKEAKEKGVNLAADFGPEDLDLNEDPDEEDMQ